MSPWRRCRAADTALVAKVERVAPGAPPAAGSPRRRLLLGVAAVLVVTVIAVIAAMRLWGGSDVSGAQRTVAVLSFTNLGGSPDAEWLSTALAELLSSEVEAAAELHSVPGQVVAEATTSLDLAEISGLSPASIAKLQQQLSCDLVVAGSYLAGERGGLERVDLRVQDAATGETVAAVTWTGLDAQLSEVASILSRRLRAALGVSTRRSSIESGLETLPQKPETASLYALALDRLRSLDTVTAVSLLDDVVTLEPGFAPARAALADGLDTLGYESRAAAEADKALALAASLPAGQRLEIESVQLRLAKRLDESAEALRALRRLYPRETRYGLQLATLLVLLGRADEAAQVVEQVREVTDGPRVDLVASEVASAQGDFVSRERFARAALTGARASDSRGIEARAYLELASALFRLGQRGAALVEASTALRIDRELGNIREQTRALNLIGVIQFRQGENEAARTAFEDALTLSEHYGMEVERGMVLSNLGLLAFKEGDVQLAERYYLANLEAYRSTGDRRTVAMTLFSLSQLWAGQGRLQQMRQALREVQEVLPEGGSMWLQGVALNHEAYVDLSLGEISRAGEASAQALELIRESGVAEQLVQALDVRAQILLAEGDLSAVRNVAAELTRLATETESADGQIAAVLLHGSVILVEGRTDEARQEVQRALQLITTLGNESIRPAALSQLALVELEVGDAAAAARAAQEAADGLSDFGNSAFEAVARALHARALATLGQKRDAEAAALRALELVADSEDRLSGLAVTLDVGVTELQLGRVETARRRIEGALADATVIGHVPLRLQASLELARAEQAAGRSAAARERLTKLEKEARQRGFALLAAKAAAALAEDAGR